MKKLLLLETEIKDPGGHYLDNLIESYYFFKNDFQIFTLLNSIFKDNGTFVPKDLNINKKIKRNNFEKKNNKFLHYIFEFLSFIYRIFLGIILIPYFSYKKLLLNYLMALISNRLILPRYFFEVYNFLLLKKFTEHDHIFFQSTRNKHMSLALFLAKLKKNIPKIHLRILYAPKNRRVGGFYFYLNQMKDLIINNKIFIYVLTKKNYETVSRNLVNKKGIYLSNIPWVFYERKKFNSFKIVGYMGDARSSRGFNKLPDLIDRLVKKSNEFKFIIQYSKVNDDVKMTSKKLHQMSKLNSNIIIIQKYLDYQEFRDTLKKIDIMPILHNAEEVSLGNPSTIYSSITHQIPMVVPSNLDYMQDVMIHKSFEVADSIEEVVEKIVQIKNNYSEYVISAKKNANVLYNIFQNDPLKKNIS